MANPMQIFMSALGGNFNNVLTQLMQGRLQGTPLMADYNKMMKGKTPQQQFETIVNAAQSMGIDVNEKCFTKQQLRQLGIKID